MPPLNRNNPNKNADPELRKKRDNRVNRRTRYFINRKDRDRTDYKGIKLFVDGQEVEINDSAKFMLEQLITDSKNTKE